MFSLSTPRGGEGWGEAGERQSAHERPPHPPSASRWAPPSPPEGRRGTLCMPPNYVPQVLNAAAFDRETFGAPAQHAAGQIGDIGKSRLLQQSGRLRRAAAGAADGDDRPVAREVAGPL